MCKSISRTFRRRVWFKRPIDGKIYVGSSIMTLFVFKSVINIGSVDKSGMTFPIKRHCDFGVLFYDDWPSPPFHYQLLVRVSSNVLPKREK